MTQPTFTRNEPSLDFLRPDNMGGRYAPHKSDYPVPLLTRRTLALCSGMILAVRRHAPCHVAFDVSRSVRPRPPC